MRKWHRWIAVFFGVFLLWISVTGVLSQVGSLVNNGGFEREEGPSKAAPPARAGQNALLHEGEDEPATAPPPVAAGAAPFVCPPDMLCRPKPVEKPGQWNVGFLHHIHSGEQFGPVGVVVSILSGLSLVFFAFSGLWMYVQMWRSRAAKSLKPGWFWK